MTTQTNDAWSAFWDEIASAEWLANVGFPLAVTLLSLALAYGLFRRQVRHDRALAKAERRADAATALGQAIRIGVKQARQSFRANDLEWPWFNQLLDAVAAARLALPGLEVIDLVQDTVGETKSTAAACSEGRREAEKESAPPSDLALVKAAEFTANKWLKQLSVLAEILAEWNGIDSIDTSDFVDPRDSDWLVLYAKDKEEYKANLDLIRKAWGSAEPGFSGTGQGAAQGSDD
jgi:hypothetical protein